MTCHDAEALNIYLCWQSPDIILEFCLFFVHEVCVFFQGGRVLRYPIRVPMDDMDKKVIGIVKEIMRPRHLRISTMKV